MEMINKPTFQPSEAKMPEVQGKKFWPRAGAYTIDVLVMYGIDYLAYIGFSYVIGILLAIVAPVIGINYYFVDADTTCMNFIVGIVQTISYFVLFEWLFGRTLGKVILNMRVISRNGNSCDLKQAFLRSFYRLVDGLFFGLVANSYMKPPVYQRLGDQKASTLVVSAEDPIVKDNPSWSKFLLALAAYMLLELVWVFIGILPFIRFS